MKRITFSSTKKVGDAYMVYSVYNKTVKGKKMQDVHHHVETFNTYDEAAAFAEAMDFGGTTFMDEGVLKPGNAPKKAAEDAKHDYKKSANIAHHSFAPTKAVYSKSQYDRITHAKANEMINQLSA